MYLGACMQTLYLLVFEHYQIYKTLFEMAVYTLAVQQVIIYIAKPFYLIPRSLITSKVSYVWYVVNFYLLNSV